MGRKTFVLRDKISQQAEAGWVLEQEWSVIQVLAWVGRKRRYSVS